MKKEKYNFRYILYLFIFALVMFAVNQTYKQIPKPQARAQIISPVVEQTAGKSAQTLPSPQDLPVSGEGSVTPTPTLQYSQEEIEGYIKTIFGKDAKVATAVSRNECGPTNKAYPKCQYKTAHENSIGLFQINLMSDYAKVHFDRVPGETLDEKIEWLLEPKNNTLMAYWIYSRAGNFNAWSAYTRGLYLKDM